MYVGLDSHMGHLCSDRTVQRHHVGLESHGFGWGREMPGEVRKPAMGPHVVDKETG